VDRGGPTPCRKANRVIREIRRVLKGFAVIPDQLRTASRNLRRLTRTCHVGRSLQRAGYAVLLAVVLAPTTWGTTVYDTIDLTNGGGGTDQNGTNAWTAVNFLPTETTTINRVAFNFAITKEDDPTATFSLGLYSSSASNGLQVPASLITEFWNGTTSEYATQYGVSIPTTQTNNSGIPYFDVSLPVTAGTYYWFVLKSSSTDLNVLWEDIGGLATPSGSWYTNISANGFLRGRQAPASTGTWNSGVNYLAGNMQMEIQVVPEPTTLPLAGLGVAVIAWGCRRLRRRAGLTG
jgi:hypothetical protein